jgi:hypothetical protein
MRPPDTITIDPIKIIACIVAIVLSVMGKVSWYVTILLILFQTGVTFELNTGVLIRRLRTYWRKIFPAKKKPAV